MPVIVRFITITRMSQPQSVRDIESLKDDLQDLYDVLQDLGAFLYDQSSTRSSGNSFTRSSASAPALASSVCSSGLPMVYPGYMMPPIINNNNTIVNGNGGGQSNNTNRKEDTEKDKRVSTAERITGLGGIAGVLGLAAKFLSNDPWVTIWMTGLNRRVKKMRRTVEKFRPDELNERDAILNFLDTVDNWLREIKKRTFWNLFSKLVTFMSALAVFVSVFFGYTEPLAWVFSLPAIGGGAWWFWKYLTDRPGSREKREYDKICACLQNVLN